MYTYSSFVTALATEAVISESNASFVTILPTIIDQAEQQCYRDLGLLATIVKDSSASTTPSTRSFTLPTASGRFVVVQSMNVLDGSDRTPLRKASREAMDMIWPSEAPVSGFSAPTDYAPFTDQVYYLGPATSGAVTIEVVGTIRPTAFSVSNTTTFLSQYLPDLFLAAGMYAMSGYMRNWSAQADDPKMALSWKADYDMRLASAGKEEMQRQFQAFASGGR